jgi:hypothetical protein
MDGYLITQLLYAAAKLGIADVLAGEPLTSDAIARAVGADPEALHRLLRGLAAEAVFVEQPDGRFGLTEVGAGLRSDTPGSLRGAVLARGDLYYTAASGLLAAVREGGIPFERVHGQPFFAHLDRHPELAAAFQGSMADRSRREAAAVVATYRFDGFRRVVDVGGGSGVLMEAILSATPGLHGILLDRPGVAERAAERLASAGLADRCACVPGDFFASLPPGGDAYLLSRVLHDWDDDAALKIIARCREAMGTASTLLVIEAVLPALARDDPAAIRMDLHMLTLLQGRERTAAEYDRLLTSAGFRLTRVLPTASPSGIAIIEASPAELPGTSAGGL